MCATHRPGNACRRRAVRHPRQQVVEKAHVFAVDIDVDETAQTAALFTQARAKARKTFVEPVDQLFYRPGLNLYGIDLSGEAAKWCWYAYRK